MLDKPDKPDWIELHSIIPLKSRKGKRERDAEQITGLSEDTLERRYHDRIKRLSDRRKGMQLRDALAIANGE